MFKILLAGVSVSTVLAAGPALAASTGYSSTWLSRIGVTDAIETQSKGGAGVIIGVVDTGIVASNPEVSGRVSSLSSCAAVSFVCSNGYYDDEGHGTATASIAAGQYNSKDLMSGVAPAATILAEKVLNASGSGTDADVANGIIKATNGGAKVINLSLTYIPTSTVVAAINYAAANGVVIVFAGGNSSANLNSGVNTTGLTSAALTHLVFVGSLSSSNTLSSFSNKPGSGYAVSGTTKVSYASLWLMAPGESIVAPGIQYGSTAYAYWTGTSMAAPMVAGSIALLEATWPVLVRNGTATTILLSTATDLGTKGVDSTYGEGELNLTKAFQPIGTLSVVTTSGKSVAVTSVTGAMLTSGALGQLSAIRASLSNYTAFDTYQRNFGVDLSKLVSSTTSFSTQVASAVSTPVVSGSTRLAGGAYLTVAASDFSFGGDHLTGVETRTLANRTFGPRDSGVFYLAYANTHGTTAAVGRGLGSSVSFANAMWGTGTAAAYQANNLGVSNALMNLAQGGYFGAIGANFGARYRVAFSLSQTRAADEYDTTPGSLHATASAMTAGVAMTLSPRWTGGVTVSSLSEKNALLGSIYSSAGLLSLGDNHRSAAISLTSNLDLGHGRSLLADATMARSSGANGSGLIGQVSTLTARGYGVSLMQEGALMAGDRLTLSLRKPLRVVDGSAQMAFTTVDSDGYSHTSQSRVSLTPNGDETDLSLAYATTLRGGIYLSAGMDYRNDAENVRGLNDVAMRLSSSWRF